MSERKSFEDRLAEMSGKPAAPKRFDTLAADTPEEVEPKRRKRGSVGTKFLLAAGLMMILGTGVTAYFQGKLGGSGVAVNGMSFAGVFDFLPKKEQPAWTHLPSAPDGWIAVTPDDAERDVQASIDTVALRYPGGEDALRAHPEFQNIGRYLDLEGRPSSLLVKKTPLTNGKILYVHPSDGIFVADIEFRREDRVLGFSDAPEGWQDSLVRFAEQDKATAAQVQRLMVHDYPAANITDPIFARQMPTRIDAGSDTFTQFNLRVALNHRTIVTFTGTAEPRVIATLIKAVDHATIAERLSRLTGRTPSLTSSADPDAEPGVVAKFLSAPADL